MSDTDDVEKKVQIDAEEGQSDNNVNVIVDDVLGELVIEVVQSTVDTSKEEMEGKEYQETNKGFDAFTPTPKGQFSEMNNSDNESFVTNFNKTVKLSPVVVR
jgi:hypothetical protein